MSWKINITSASFDQVASGPQTVDISYRQAGTGVFAPAGVMYFNPDGTINGAPNPFVISGISDDWTSVEVKAVNRCNSSETTKTFTKP